MTRSYLQQPLYKQAPFEELYRNSEHANTNYSENGEDLRVPEKGNLSGGDPHVESHAVQYKKHGGEFLIREKRNDSAGNMRGKGDHELVQQIDLLE